MPNFCMTLSYDGTRYNGWQRQGNTPDTIQGRLETVLSDLLDQPVEHFLCRLTDFFQMLF